MGLFSRRKKREQGLARAAFEVLVREHHRSLLAFAKSLIRDGAAAEDIVQEAFMVGWRKMDRFDPSQDFGAWMRGIVRFEYLHWIRKHREVPIDDEIIERIENPHAQLQDRSGEHEDLMDAVRQCVTSLPDQLRETVMAVYQAGMSCPELAKRDQASESAVRKRLQRGRDFVAECLQKKTGVKLAAA